MGEFWDKLKVILGFGASNDSSQDASSPGFEDRILNANRHKFKVKEPEPQGK
ncbi:MAG: hypothetical protein JXB42_01485 [Deltaproteobacteria bacterium]|nr:hypothetical protein [Deltaproteobacteria bacterium]